MTSVFNQIATAQGNRDVFRLALGSACFALACAASTDAWAAQKTAVKVGATLEAPTPEAPSLARDMPPREIELVVVWGFRLRSTEHDLRKASLTSGYNELIEKAACISSLCGYVVVKDGDKWRTTNVVAATEGELQDMQRNMEREGTTLVIVHPTGTKRTIPEF